nr:ribonuclease H-like domain-containing protein [Tanacetum cinerariifolium]
MKGLSEYEASESNIRCIRVKDIVKEVEEYLKTYSSAGMDISLQETKYLLKAGQNDSDSDVEEDQRTSNEFMADLNAEYHERALLANQEGFYKRSGKSTIVGDLEDKGVASTIKSTPSFRMISKHCLSSIDSLSSFIFCFLAFSCSSSSLALFELPSVTFALAFFELYNTNSVITQATAVNSITIDNLSDAVICSFFSSQPNSPQLDNEDLQQIYLDDLKEMDLRWQMTMLTMRARRFLKSTRRKFSMNSDETIRFDKSKVECYNYHKRNILLESAELQEVKIPSTRSTVLVETPTSSALVSCGELGVETSEAKASADKPKVVRKDFGPTLIEDWISDSEDETESKSKIEKETVKPSFAKIKFVKSKEQVKSPRKTTVKQVNVARPMSHFSKSAHSTIKRPFDKKIEFTNSNIPQKVSTVRSQTINTARLKAVVNAVLGNPQQDLQNKGVIDRECSRHMTRNISYLTNYEEIDGGYVAFGGNPKGGKLTGRCTIKTGKLDFENVYFVKEFKFNLFSVSQMCDKNNSVLFNDTECIVLSLNFKLTDESHVLLKVLRKNNMYSVDLKNIVPKGDLTCLFAKATSDESKLWHRRLGHLNFKTMNKLVKENLVLTPQRACLCVSYKPLVAI